MGLNIICLTNNKICSDDKVKNIYYKNFKGVAMCVNIH